LHTFSHLGLQHFSGHTFLTSHSERLHAGATSNVPAHNSAINSLFTYLLLYSRFTNILSL
jgi:hypothetical protein